MHAWDELQTVMGMGRGRLLGDPGMSHSWPDTSGLSVLAFNERRLSLLGQGSLCEGLLCPLVTGIVSYASICSHLPAYLTSQQCHHPGFSSRAWSRCLTLDSE